MELDLGGSLWLWVLTVPSGKTHSAALVPLFRLSYAALPVRAVTVVNYTQTHLRKSSEDYRTFLRCKMCHLWSRRWKILEEWICFFPLHLFQIFPAPEEPGLLTCLLTLWLQKYLFCCFVHCLWETPACPLVFGPEMTERFFGAIVQNSFYLKRYYIILSYWLHSGW